MKRFLLIAGGNYYPQQGTRDWIDSFDTYEEADSVVSTRSDTYPQYKVEGNDWGYDWYEIIDLDNWKPGD